MATRLRPGYVRRRAARLDSATAPSRLRIRLRAAFGVNARADVLAALLAASPSGLSIADLGRQTRFTKPNVASTVDSLLLADLVTARAVGNERRVLLVGTRSILPGLRPPVPQPDWVSRFRVALAVHRFVRQDGRSTTVQAIEARLLVEAHLDPIAAEGMPKPNLDALGDEFAGAFDRWAAELADWLRSSVGSLLPDAGGARTRCSCSSRIRLPRQGPAQVTQQQVEMKRVRR